MHRAYWFLFMGGNLPLKLASCYSSTCTTSLECCDNHGIILDSRSVKLIVVKPLPRPDPRKREHAYQNFGANCLEVLNASFESVVQSVVNLHRDDVALPACCCRLFRHSGSA
uniref:Secreted protein n=1 Tax=Panagrellus redivivus TaxID=6233 RepID=A0A7E4UPD1_PANRE